MADVGVQAVYALRYLQVIEAHALRRERVFRDRTNAFELHEREFRHLFRLPRFLVMELIDSLRDVLPKPSRRSALSTETQVLATLRFYAEGGYQRGIGQEATIMLSQKSVSRCVIAVSKAISESLLSQWIRFPQNMDELMAMKTGFWQDYKFPGVIGAIDCTHVLIVAPTTDAEHHEVAYVNRKGRHSINVQLISDSRMRILNINARYPGSTHDSFIWSSCNLRQRIVEADGTGVLVDSWLIGDSGYPLEPWLLTPVPDAERGSGANRFNVAHRKLRSIVERLNGLLKQIWRCLLQDRIIHCSPNRASNIIVSCAVLYNMFVDNNFPLPEDVILPPPMQNVPGEDDQNENPVAAPERGNPLANRGKSNQQKLIRNHFRVAKL